MAKQNQSPGFIHNVFFWLKEEITEDQKKAFLKALKSLGEINTVCDLYTGTPAGTPRVVVDNTYDFALIVHLDDQVDPIHEAFAASQSHLWEKVQVFDVLIK